MNWNILRNQLSFGLYEKEISKPSGLMFLEVTDPQYIITWRFTEQTAASLAKWEDTFLALQQEYGSLKQIENTVTAVNHSFLSKQRAAMVAVGIVIPFFGSKAGLVKKCLIYLQVIHKTS